MWSESSYNHLILKILVVVSKIVYTLILRKVSQQYIHSIWDDEHLSFFVSLTCQDGPMLPGIFHSQPDWMFFRKHFVREKHIYN